MPACTSATLVEDQLTDPKTITALGLGTVRFEYAQWVNRDEEDLAMAKTNEASWIHALGGAFLARVAERGFSGTENQTRVDVTVLDLDPGSRSTRFWIGFGAGSGTAAVRADAAGHGSFRMNGTITHGDWGGDFVRVMEKLGSAIAEHLVKLAKGTSEASTGPDS